MNKILTWFMMAILLASVTPLTAQERTTAKEKRKMTREERKLARQKEDEKLFQTAIDALKKQDFVLEAQTLTFKKGQTISVTPSTNFISMSGDRATVQVSFVTGRPLQNGLGGVTVEGKVSDIKMSTDKKGRVSYSFYVQGLGISAYVNISLVGNNKASATILPSFHSNTLILNGNLVPSEKSNTFEGRKL